MRLKDKFTDLAQISPALLFAAFITGCFAALTAESLIFGLRVAGLLFVIALIPRIRLLAAIAGLYSLVWSLSAGFESWVKAWHRSPWSPFTHVPFVVVLVLAVFAALLWFGVLAMEFDWFYSRRQRRRAQPSPDADQDVTPMSESLQPECFSLLGVSPTAAVDEIKHAYREQVKRYHPDRVAGLGEELQELATRKTIELRDAQEQALSLAAARA